MTTQLKIVGAGLAGLSAAYHLEEYSGEVDYEVFEKDERVGGLCKSEVVDGLVFDYAVHVVYTKDEYVRSLVKTLLKDNLCTHVRESWIYSKGVYTRYPFQANTYGLPPEVIRDCILGLIRLHCTKNKNPRNFREWIYSTFGDGIANHFMTPYNLKMWAIPLEDMGFDWIHGRVLTPRIEDVLAGALREQKKGFGPNAEFLYPLKGGIESLSRGFRQQIKNKSISLNTEVTKIDVGRKTLEVEEGGGNTDKVCFDRLLTTIPLPKLVELIVDAPKAVKIAASNLKYNIIYTVNLGVNRENISEKHWIYFPENKFIFHRLSFPMNFSPNMAPKDMSSITVEVSHSRYKRIDESNLVQKVVADLVKADILGKKDDVVTSTRLTLSPAYVIYDLNHEKNVGVINRFLKKKEIISFGRFGSWKYLNMDHTILEGREVVQKILQE